MNTAPIQNFSLEQAIELALQHHQAGRLVEAELAYRRAITINSDYAEVYINFGNVLYERGLLEEAKIAYCRAIAIEPDCAMAHFNLGNLYYALGLCDEAVSAYRLAITINPEYDSAYLNLGIVLNQLGRLDEARVAYRQATAINTTNAELYCNFADVLRDLGRLDEAVTTYHHAIALKPEHSQSLNGLGVTHGLRCRLSDAVIAFRQAIAHKPDFAVAHSNLLLTLQYIYSLSQEEAFIEALNYGHCFDKSFNANRRSHQNRYEPAKRLKVGFMSGHLNDHPVGYFLESVLQCIDRESVTLYAYANQSGNDRLSDRIKGYFEKWLLVKEMSDEKLAVRISADEIDILIDLDGHTSGNRLRTFVYKPAPIQVTWLGYPNTTGLTSIDYILADPITAPKNEERFYTEKIWRLPDTSICFTPPDFNLEVNPLPALKNGYITFGCFNNPAKLTDEVLSCWSEILRAVPNSVLLLKIRQAISQVDFFRQRFLKHGIDPTRVRLEGTIESRLDLVASYRFIDIALDPFPYNGTTTTCEAAWMGVPTLTLQMPRGIYSHNGELIMRMVGLSNWVADSVEGYVGTARKMAMEIPLLAKIRTDLRDQLLHSPLCNAPRFAHNLQMALRGMWQQRCSQNPAIDTPEFRRSDMSRKLHIGGKTRATDWEIFSIEAGLHVDHVGNAKDLSRFPENTFSAVYASHVLEHFDFVDEIQETLVEWNRVLKPGGILYVSVPNLDVLMRLYLDKDRQDIEEQFLLMRMMFGGHTNKYDYHSVGFNDELLLYYLHKAEFINPKKLTDFGIFQDTSGSTFKGELISLNMIAHKK